MRALAARDKMTEDTRRQTVMPPEMNEASTTQDIAERQKRCKAGKDVESRRQSRAAKKAANEHEIEMSRIDDKQQCSRKKAMTRNAQQAQRQQLHRAREQAAQHDKDTNLVEVERTQKDVERKSTRRDDARRRKQRSRAAASALASQSTATKAANTVIKNTTVAMNTTGGITQGSHVEHQAAEALPGDAYNLLNDDDNDNSSQQHPESQQDVPEAPHPELVELHRCKASIITMNAMRLEPLKRMGLVDELAIARADTCTDINKFGVFDLKNKATCTREYQNKKKIVMRVCGTCGKRCPSDTYKEITLTKLPIEHWMRVPEGVDSALNRMRAWEKMNLAKCKLNGEYTYVEVERERLHNMVEIKEAGGGMFHIIPEALYDEENVQICSRCALGFDNSTIHKPEQHERPIAHSAGVVDANVQEEDNVNRGMPMIDTLDDLYYKSAPPNTVAAGEDYGNLNALKKQGINTDLTTHEILVLAEARCHYVTLKLEAQEKRRSEEKLRRTLSGTTIVFPHQPVATPEEFGEKALKAALGAIRVYLVGPNGAQGQLEKTAMQIDDYRLRPDVLYNFLTIRHVLHGYAMPPTIEVVQEMIDTHSDIDRHVREVAVRMALNTTDMEIERSSICPVRGEQQSTSDDESDGPTKTSGETSTAANQEGMPQDREGEQETPTTNENVVDEDDVPVLQLIEHIEMPSQNIATVMDGIAEAMSEEEEKDRHKYQDTNEYQSRHMDHLKLKRGDKAMDDYLGGPEMMYKAYWPLMPLRRGFAPGKCIPDSKWRQLFLYHDNRFCTNQTILFHVASIIMRHAVNKSVHAGIKAKPESFAAFKKEMETPGFKEELEKARDNPRSKEAGRLIQRLMRFISLSGANIPWSPEERRRVMTYIIANHRYFGPGSIFYTYAPDDVHDLDVIRYAHAYTCKGEFPETVPLEYLRALQGQSNRNDQRVCKGKEGENDVVLLDMRDRAVQRLLAANNPIACAAIFEHITENVRENLLGSHGKRKIDIALDATLHK